MAHSYFEIPKPAEKEGIVLFITRSFLDSRRLFFVQVPFWNYKELVAADITEKDSVAIIIEPLFPVVCVLEGLVCITR